MKQVLRKLLKRTIEGNTETNVFERIEKPANPSDKEIEKLFWQAHYVESMETDQKDARIVMLKAAIRLYRLAYKKGYKDGIEEGCTCEEDNEPPDKEGYND